MPIARGSDKEPVGADSPEALMISALLGQGQFTPDKLHVVEDDLQCWNKLWRFCAEYQEKSGEAPPVSLVKRKYPDFEYVPDVRPGWAAHQLLNASASRRLRGTMGEALALLRDDDVAGAYDLLGAAHRPKSSRREPVDLFDHKNIEQEFAISRIPVPWSTLDRTTGGIGPGELWYFAARPGQGKTFSMCQFAATAALSGLKIEYLSLEMSASAIARRTARIMAYRDKPILKMLDSGDPLQVKKGIDALKEKCDGQLKVSDPSHGKMNTSAVQQAQDHADLVIVDHVGLMHSSDGRRAIDDWRVMALISNTLKEACLASGVPVLAASQANRQAENHSWNPPKVSELSQGDALGQDGDVVITMKRPSNSVQVFSGEKIREGANKRWYCRFDVKNADFREISHETALDLAAIDGDDEARTKK